MNECVIIFYDCLFIQIKIMFLLCVVLFKPPKIFLKKNSESNKTIEIKKSFTFYLGKYINSTTHT